MHFDADKEAAKIESMAKERIDTPNDKAAGVSKKLTDEWASLTQSERDQVAKSIEAKYSNHSCDALPIPAPVTDGNGHCVALIFRASSLDFNTGPVAIDLWTASSANGSDRAELSARESRRSNNFIPETAQP